MPSKLKTDYVRIGRSGPTVDGRTIEPQALTQAAEHYDPALFTALIFPDHYRWLNLGKVESLRAEDNDEGGVDLFAVISPNDYYLRWNKDEQYLFTSMELQPNFRDSGEYYLTGLAATDSPASAATTEMRFSKLEEPKTLCAAFTEATPHAFDNDQPPGWFTRFFSKQDDTDMDKKALDALTEKFNQLEKRLNDLHTHDDGDNDDDAPPADQFAALSSKVDDLLDKFAALEQQINSANEQSAQVSKLVDEFNAFKAEFKKALTHDGGTDAGEHLGDGIENDDYLY